MVNPRYDPEEDVSRHSAVSPEDCIKMAKNQGWKLVRTEKLNQDILDTDCIFKGKTEFPSSY